MKFYLKFLIETSTIILFIKLNTVLSYYKYIKILIIKHGSLGDIAQASGAIQDIFENHKNDRIYLLTTKAYLEVCKKNPFIHEVILDKRLPRYNLIYLYFLMKQLKKFKFTKVFDLQNSSRTNFYRNIIFQSLVMKFGQFKNNITN